MGVRVGVQMRMTEWRREELARRRNTMEGDLVRGRGWRGRVVKLQVKHPRM